MEAKRQVVGQIVDDYGVQPQPLAEAEAPDVAPASAGQPALSEEDAMGAIEAFAEQNPIARDELVLERMTHVAGEMLKQGFQPDLATAFQHAVAADPRYSEAARQAQVADHLAAAKAGSVQISGGGNTAPNPPPSDDLREIIGEQVPRS